MQDLTHEKNRIRQVEGELLPELLKLSSLPLYAKHVPKEHPPARLGEIESYERWLGVRLPGSYRAFLELHDGYDELAFPGHMISIKGAMPNGYWYPYIQKWKKSSAMFGDGRVIDGIVIANLSQPNNWVYLDPRRPSKDNEFTVVLWTPTETVEFQDVIEFLEDCLNQCRLILAAEIKALT
ncbi:MAG: SMI1/KNR4 family protein [Nitrospira defluvii]|nr:SMI1/KNR4 family protein [Nitrospira defluvii]